MSTQKHLEKVIELSHLLLYCYYISCWKEQVFNGSIFPNQSSIDSASFLNNIALVCQSLRCKILGSLTPSFTTFCIYIFPGSLTLNSYFHKVNWMFVCDHLLQVILYKWVSLTDFLQQQYDSDSHQLQFFLDWHSILHQVTYSSWD